MILKRLVFYSNKHLSCVSLLFSRFLKLFWWYCCRPPWWWWPWAGKMAIILTHSIHSLQLSVLQLSVWSHGNTPPTFFYLESSNVWNNFTRLWRRHKYSQSMSMPSPIRSWTGKIKPEMTTVTDVYSVQCSVIVVECPSCDWDAVGSNPWSGHTNHSKNGTQWVPRVGLES